MRSLFKKHNIGNAFLRTLIACFLFFHTSEIYPIAPPSRFDNCKPVPKKQFINQAITVYGLLRLASARAKNPHELKKIKPTLDRFERILLQHGVPITVERVGYVESQPGVIYCFLMVGGKERIVRIFSRESENEIYPAEILAREYFEKTAASAEIISSLAYNAIKIGDREISCEPGHARNRFLLPLCSWVNCFIGLGSNLDWLAGIVHNPVSYWCLAVSVSAIAIAASLDFIRSRYPKKAYTGAGNFYSPINRFMEENSGNILIGVETGWLSEIYGRRKIEKIIRGLQKKYKGRITLLHSRGDRLASQMIKEVRERGVGLESSILIASGDILYSKRCQWLAESGATCIAVDTTNMRDAEDALRTKENFLVDIPRILRSAIDLYLGKSLTDTDYIQYIYTSTGKAPFVKFRLRPRILRIDDIDSFYESQLKYLLSA